MLSNQDRNVITIFKQMLRGDKPKSGDVDHHILPAKHQLTIEQAEKYCDLCLRRSGTNKRPVGLLPLPVSDNVEDHEIIWSHSLEPVQLLASLEVRCFSGIVRIFSDNRRFRTAMLFFKGRVIGCIYTRFNLARVLLDEQACNAFLSRLCESGNLVHAYRLEPDLVLAASAIFHSAAQKRRSNMATADLAIEAMTPILGNLRTGSIAINTNEGTVCSVYVRLGVIIGVYSYRDGWLKPEVDSIVQSLEGVGVVEMFDNTVSILHEDDYDFLTIRSVRIVWRRWIIQQQRKEPWFDLNEIESNAPPGFLEKSSA